VQRVGAAVAAVAPALDPARAREHGHPRRPSRAGDPQALGGALLGQRGLAAQDHERAETLRRQAERGERLARDAAVRLVRAAEERAEVSLEWHTVSIADDQLV
jgi:hypothetical protein